MDITAAKGIINKFKTDMMIKAGADFLAANAKKTGVISLPTAFSTKFWLPGLLVDPNLNLLTK